MERRDGEHERYGGKGTRIAVKQVIKVIGPRIIGLDATRQAKLDQVLINLDGTPEKSALVEQTPFLVSLATARAAAHAYRQPLYRYLGGISAHTLPVPMMNVLNGGKHASHATDLQEYLLLPIGASTFHEALHMGSEVYHSLRKVLQEKS